MFQNRVPFFVFIVFVFHFRNDLEPLFRHDPLTIQTTTLHKNSGPALFTFHFFHQKLRHLTTDSFVPILLSNPTVGNVEELFLRQVFSPSFVDFVQKHLNLGNMTNSFAVELLFGASRVCKHDPHKFGTIPGNYGVLVTRCFVYVFAKRCCEVIHRVYT